jgi:hypothetical protein
LKQGKSPANKRDSGRFHHSFRVIEVRFAGGEIKIYPCVRLVALALGVNPSTVNRWLNGSVSPHPKHMVEMIVQI